MLGTGECTSTFALSTVSSLPTVYSLPTVSSLTIVVGCVIDTIRFAHFVVGVSARS